MKTWRGNVPVVLLGMLLVILAYLFGSASVLALPGCGGCPCKNIKAWKVLSDTNAQGLVDAMGDPTDFGYTGICVATCTNETVTNYTFALNRMQYNNPTLTCDNTAPASMCRGTTQEADGTLTTTVLGQTTYAFCFGIGRPTKP